MFFISTQDHLQAVDNGLRKKNHPMDPLISVLMGSCKVVAQMLLDPLS